MMTCAEFERRLHDRLDRRQSLDDPELDLHAAQCAGCQALRRRLVLVLEGFHGAALPRLAPDLAAEVRRAAGRRRSVDRKPASIVTLLATAAVLAVLVLSHRKPAADRSPAVTHRLERGGASRPGAATSPSPPAIDEASIAGRELIRDTAGPVSDLAVGLLPGPVPVDRLVPGWNGPVGLVKELPPSVQATAQPLAAALGQAFDFLRIPPGPGQPPGARGKPAPGELPG